MNTHIIPQERKCHHGQNLQFFRLLRNIKQEVLADSIGLSQSALSRLEMRERVDDEMLQKIAKELDLPVETIKDFDREKAVNMVLGMYPNDAAFDAAHTVEEYPHLLGRIEKLEKSLVSQQEFYDRLLKEKEERCRCLEQLVQQLKTE